MKKSNNNQQTQIKKVLKFAFMNEANSDAIMTSTLNDEIRLANFESSNAKNLEDDESNEDNERYVTNNESLLKVKQLTHPLSSSILKTTKSIFEDSMTISVNQDLCKQQSENTTTSSSNSSGEEEDCDDANSFCDVAAMAVDDEAKQMEKESKEVISMATSQEMNNGIRRKSILKDHKDSFCLNATSTIKNRDSLSSNEASATSNASNVSYFKMFEAFLYDKKPNLKLKSCANNTFNLNNEKEMDRNALTGTPPPCQLINKTQLLSIDINENGIKDERAIFGVQSNENEQEAERNNAIIATPVQESHEESQEQQKQLHQTSDQQFSPTYSLRSSYVNSSMTSSVISPTSSVFNTETKNHLEQIVELNKAETKSSCDEFTVSIIENTPKSTNQISSSTKLNEMSSSSNSTRKRTLIPPPPSALISSRQLKRNFSDFSANYNNGNSYYIVEIRTVFLKVGDIDTLNEKFYAEAFIEAKWVDFSLNVNEKYDNDAHWNPQLYILNCLGELKQQIWYNQYSLNEYDKLNQSLPISNINIHQMNNTTAEMTIDGNTFDSSLQSLGCVIVERRRISGTFWQTLDLKNFPADVQFLTISLTTPKHISELRLMHCKDRPSCVNIKCFVDSQEWRLYEHVKTHEFIRDSVFTNETFSALDLTINAARRPTFYYWNAFFLIFLITLSSLSIFSIRCHLNQSRIQTTCTLLLTSITFKWVTNRSLPTVSYMTSLDKYSIGCLLLICAQCLWHAIISCTMEMEQKCVEPFSSYDRFAFSLFCIIFFLMHFVFVCWLIARPYKQRRQLNKQEMDYANQVMGKRSTRLKSMMYGNY